MGDSESGVALAPRRQAGPGRPTARRPAGPVGPAKNPVLAAVLAFLIPGLGHLYVGRVVAGLLIMFGLPVAFVVVAIVALGAAIFGGGAVAGEQGAMAGAGGAYLLLMAAYFAGFVWQLYDAYVSAERTGRPAPALRGRRPRR